ncbi:MAG: hypothetical protein GX221_07470 [Candidatus Riflebacteria bacterium]|nr:hypothetical protein [Candidatus Riflebacteria bacterium]
MNSTEFNRGKWRYNKTLIIGLLCSSAVFFALFPLFALDPKYERNGECYLMIGEGIEGSGSGAKFHRGVYRMNNAPKQEIYTPPEKVVTPTTEAFSFSADLNRNLHVFEEQVKAPVWPTHIYRQVVDNVEPLTIDFGSHDWMHYDYRPASGHYGLPATKKNAPLYRTGPRARVMNHNTSSAGPGTPTGVWGDNNDYAEELKQIPITGNLALGVYSGKQWFKIPNGAFYSSWRQKPSDFVTSDSWKGYSWVTRYVPLDSWPPRYFYVVYSDKVCNTPHHWVLVTNEPQIDNDTAKNLNYQRKNPGEVVGVTNDSAVYRQILAGCMDGCGGASGEGSGVSQPLLADVAFMPKDNTRPRDRTYFYSRPKNGRTFNLTVNGSPCAAGSPTVAKIIGDGTDLTTKWVGVSAGKNGKDYIYLLGTEVIKSWYREIFGGASPDMDIQAVGVSNQWSEEGGIVYAYDTKRDYIYKFVRKEDNTTPVSELDFLAINAQEILEAIGVEKHIKLDEIRADGFGNLFMAISKPLNPALASTPLNPDSKRICQTIRLNDAEYITVAKKKTITDPEVVAYLLYPVDFSKAVYRRNILNGRIEYMGEKVFARLWYNLMVEFPSQADYDNFINEVSAYKDTSGEFFGLNESADLESSLLGAGAGIVYEPPSLVSQPLVSPTAVSWEHYARGVPPSVADFAMFSAWETDNPGKVKLSVINVQTPPKVYALKGKNSFLDIVGPYEGGIPVHVEQATIRTVNQDDGLLSHLYSASNDKVRIDLSKLYFFMVENYPLESGAQNPNLEKDWNANNKKGGFMTGIRDPRTKKNGGDISYEWRIFMVEDMLKNPVFTVTSNDPESGQPSQTERFAYLYSPMPAKYVIACRATYDWYDYDAMPFGTTAGSLKNYKKTGAKAIPVRDADFNHFTVTEQLQKIFSDPSFSPATFTKKIYGDDGMLAATQTISYRDAFKQNLGDEYWRLIPVIASGTYKPNVNETEICQLERCDWFSDCEGYILATDSIANSYWWSTKTAADNHGLSAGERYLWRISLASQTALLNDISKLTGTNPEDKANFNYVAYKLTTEKIDEDDNPMWIDPNDKFRFQNKKGDVRWKSKEIKTEASLSFETPVDNSGKLEIETVYLGDNVKGDLKSFKYVETSPGLLPTDPMIATLTITMRREFEYDVWVLVAEKKDDGTIKKNPAFKVNGLPGIAELTGQATVLVVDSTPPRILFAETSPNQINLETGKPFPEQNLQFTIIDNSRWNALKTQPFGKDGNMLGFTKEKSKANALSNAYVLSQIAYLKSAKLPSSHLQLKPVYSFYNRETEITYSMTLIDNKFNDTTTNKLVEVSHESALKKKASSDTLEPRFLAFKHPDGALILSDSAVTDNVKAADGSSLSVRRGKVVYNLDLSQLKSLDENKLPVNKVPIAYANNSLGYTPYVFKVRSVDSSGNEMEWTSLNSLMEVKDIIPPIPFLSITEHKNMSTSVVPNFRLDSGSAAYGDMNAYSKAIGGKTIFSSIFELGTSKQTWKANSLTGQIGDGVNAMFAMPPHPTQGAGLGKLGKGMNMSTPYGTLVRTPSIPPAAVENNVLVTFRASSLDNSGQAKTELTYVYLDGDNKEKTASCSTDINKYEQKPVSGGYKMESYPFASSIGVFRGTYDDFPMAAPLMLKAVDNARDHDKYIWVGDKEPSTAVWDPIENLNRNPVFELKYMMDKEGEPSPNETTLNSSLPVWGSRLEAMPIERTIRSE